MDIPSLDGSIARRIAREYPRIRNWTADDHPSVAKLEGPDYFSDPKLQVRDLDPIESEMEMPYMNEVLYIKPTKPRPSRAEKGNGGSSNKLVDRTDTSMKPGLYGVKPLLMITNGRLGHADFEVDDDDDFVDPPPIWHGTPSHGNSPIGDGHSGDDSNPDTPHSVGATLHDEVAEMRKQLGEMKSQMSTLKNEQQKKMNIIVRMQGEIRIDLVDTRSNMQFLSESMTALISSLMDEILNKFREKSVDNVVGASDPVEQGEKIVDVKGKGKMDPVDAYFPSGLEPPLFDLGIGYMQATQPEATNSKELQAHVDSVISNVLKEIESAATEALLVSPLSSGYLDDLVNRNLVMVGERRSNGKVKTCHVHDMLHVFCKNQAAEENFFQEIKRFDQVTYSSSNPALEMYRRLCIHSRVWNYLSSKPFGPRVRSFLCFSSEEINLQAELTSSIPGAFKLLRVLDAKPIFFTRFPTDLAQLVHLRYLVLSSNFKILPAAISSLWNMQTLIVETSSRTLEIKGDIWKMIQLRHLKTNASTSLPGPLSKSRKRKDDSLINANLKTLSTISPESCTEDVFARAPNLKKLGIRGRLAKLLDARGASSLFGSLGKLDHLEILKLLNDVFPDPPSEGRLAGLPQRYNFPPKLKKLTLADTLLDWNQMATLGMLESLEILKLKDNAFKGEWWQPEDGGFRALKVLFIGRTDLVHWNASTHHFPRLRSLYLKHCSSLEEVPLSLADVSSLQLIDLYCTTKSAAASARKIQNHKKKMKNDAEKQSTKGIVFKLSVYPPDQDQ